MQTTLTKKAPLDESFKESIAHLHPQYQDPCWRALWLAYEGNEINLDSYLALCNDFHFLPF